MAAWNPVSNEIFLKAVEIPSPDDRRAYLDEACHGDDQLRRQVEALIAAGEQAGSFLESPHPGLTAAVASLDVSESPGSIIGPYRLLEEIGEGGMGVVYMADQQAPVRRRVALKIIKPGMDTRQVIARFEAERQALALMDHPNIARVLDAGATDSGRPYFVMELVRGIAITEYCDQNNLPIHERLELYVHVCHAVQHAHQKGIIHRDLKPSNVLVTLHDGRPVPKVIDFGVAKATNQQLTEKTLFTNFAQMVGTPLYMSPEQAEMTSLDIDTRSDVYSLGVLLYELLTGTTPFDKERLREAAYDELRRIIREEEPQKPSTRLSSLGVTRTAIAAHRRVDPQRLPRMIRGDLDWIVMKSLEKDRTRRYETANGLARDVQRYLSDQPVEACPPSSLYRFRKFARRNRPALLTGALISTVLVLGVFISTWQAIRATRSEHRAETARGEEVQQRRIAEEERSEAEKQRALAEAQRNDANEQRRLAETNLQQARKAVDDYFTLVSESTLLDVPGLQPLRRELLEAALRFYKGFAADRADDPAGLADLAITYMRVAEIYHATDRNDDAVAAIDNALPVIDRLRRDFPDDKVHQRRLAGFWKGHRRVEPTTMMPKNPRAAFKSLNRLIDTMQVLAAENPDEPGFRSDVAALCFRTGDLVSSDNQRSLGVKFYERSKVLLEELVHDQPNAPEHRADLARVYQNLAANMPFIGREQDIEAVSRQALALREQLVAKMPKIPQYRADLVFSLLKCAGLLDRRNPAEAEKLFARAQEVSASLVREFPDNTLYRADLAKSKLAHLVTRVTAETNEGVDKILQTADDSIATFLAENPNDQQARQQLAWALTDAADRSQAKPALREQLLGRELAMHAELANEIHDNSSHIQQVGHVHRHLGWLHRSRGELDAAPQDFEKGAAAFAELAALKSLKMDGVNRAYHGDSLVQLAQVLGAVGGRAAEGVTVAQQSVDIFGGLVSDFPDNSDYRQMMSDAVRMLAQNLIAAGQPDGAVQAWRQQISFLEKLPDVPREAINPQLASAYQSLCWSLLATRQFEEAQTAWEKARRLVPADPQSLNDFAWSVANERNVEPAAAALAVRVAQQAAEAAPRTMFFNTLGVAQYRAGNWADAIASSTKANELSPDRADFFNGFFLAMSHWQLGQKDEARAWYDRAVVWMEKNQPKNNDLLRFRAEAEELLDSSNDASQSSPPAAAASPQG